MDNGEHILEGVGSEPPLDALEQKAIDDALGETADEDGASLREAGSLEVWRGALLSLRERNEARISRLKRRIEDEDGAVQEADPRGSALCKKALREEIAVQHALQERLAESRELLNERNRRLQASSDPKVLLRRALPYVKGHSTEDAEELAEDVERYLEQRGG